MKQFLLMFVLAGAYAHAQDSQPKPNPAPAAVIKSVPIRFDVNAQMFPSEWRDDPIKATAIPIHEGKNTSSLQAIENALKLYPETLLRKNLREIYIVKSLSFYDLPYGGTNSLDQIFLTCELENPTDSAEFLKQALHHELSSILLRNYPEYFDRKAWDKSLPTTFQYTGSGKDSVANGASNTNYNPDLMRNGFLTQYSQSSLEEDFNMIAEGMMSGRGEFWQAVDHYPKVKAKADAVIRLYGRLVPEFTEQYLRSLVSKTKP
ncbi:MAG: hypothetical protein R2688_05340 [Fimbriimonadaceae bacterium]